MEIQLVRESGGENDKTRDRWVDLYVGADGSARLSHHDLRPSLKELPMTKIMSIMLMYLRQPSPN